MQAKREWFLGWKIVRLMDDFSDSRIHCDRGNIAGNCATRDLGTKIQCILINISLQTETDDNQL